MKGEEAGLGRMFLWAIVGLVLARIALGLLLLSLAPWAVFA